MTKEDKIKELEVSVEMYKKDDLMTYEEYKDGTTEEKDNKEDVQE